MRSDLQAQPVRTAPGQEYGQAKAQADAQRAVPMAGAPIPPAPGPAMGPPPGGLGGFLDPTQRPDEPVTAGVPAGLGPGPEALAMNRTPAASADDAADLEALLPYLPALELMASQPGASAAARNFIRRLRGSQPPA